MEFHLWYTRYNPDSYFGHRHVHLKAKDMAAAEIEAKALLDCSSVKGPFEYVIYEVKADSGYKMYPQA